MPVLQNGPQSGIPESPLSLDALEVLAPHKLQFWGKICWVLTTHLFLLEHCRKDISRRLTIRVIISLTLIYPLDHAACNAHTCFQSSLQGRLLFHLQNFTVIYLIQKSLPRFRWYPQPPTLFEMFFQFSLLPLLFLYWDGWPPFLPPTLCPGLVSLCLYTEHCKLTLLQLIQESCLNYRG